MIKERPILFSGPMVRAILKGDKTQTRRVIKAKHLAWLENSPLNILSGKWNQRPLPYGKVGDKLWVKETTINVEEHGYEGPVYAESDDGRAILAGGLAPSEDDCCEVEPHEIRLRPSIFMSRVASRITLEITGVRIERLQDISEQDAIAEGIQHADDGRYVDYLNDSQYADPRQSFGSLWASINGIDSWSANSLVWVIEFKKLEPNK